MTTAEKVYQTLLTGDLYRLRVETVASSLCMSKTKLYARLQAEGTNYLAIRSLVRMKRCENLFNAGCRRGQPLAEALGFRSTTAFLTAFKRWTGVCFQEFKRRHAEGVPARIVPEAAE